MLELLTRIFGRENNSAQVARDRLRLVLVHDRASVSPQLLESLKNDLMKVISSYMDIDESAMDVQLSGDDGQVALVANIPVKGMKRTTTAR